MPTAQELLIGIPGVLLLVVIWAVIARSTRRAVVETDALFAKLGFIPADRLSGGPASVYDTARSYVGSYRGYPAGFTQGAEATIGISCDVGTSELSSTVRSGSEFWLALGFEEAAFLVVERDETRSDELASFCPMAKALPTGNAAFDARFKLFCANESWGLAVLDADLQKRMLALPYVLLLQTRGRCYFSFFYGGAQRTSAAFGTGLRWLETLAKATDFLDLLVCVAQRMSALRQP